MGPALGIGGRVSSGVSGDRAMRGVFHPVARPGPVAIPRMLDTAPAQRTPRRRLGSHVIAPPRCQPAELYTVVQRTPVSEQARSSINISYASTNMHVKLTMPQACFEA